jgi:methionyl-tRNA synthetase
MDPSPKPVNLNYGDFIQFDIRIGTIIQAEAVPKSKKLLKLQVSFGTETRTILAGIAQHSDPATLVASKTKVVAVLNLAPRMMMGIESHGMLLAAHDAEGIVWLLGVNGAVPDGTEVG